MDVWANSGNEQNFMGTHEWEAFRFQGLGDLCEIIQNRSLAPVQRLAIVSHGDAGGYVGLTPELTYQNFESHRNELIRLKGLLGSPAQILFLACTAAAGENGDKLFLPMSEILADCDVIGFVTPNKVFGPFPGWGSLIVQSKNSTRNDEYSEEAKWFKNGAVVRPPEGEYLAFEGLDPTFKKRCGSERCPGHAVAGRDVYCAPYTRRAWPKWLVTNAEMERLVKAANARAHPGPGVRLQRHKHSHHAHEKKHMLPFASPAHSAGPGGFRKQGVYIK